MEFFVRSILSSHLQAALRVIDECAQFTYLSGREFLVDERRPRFGLMRSRDFIMKDAYSFDRDEAGLDKSYEEMYDAYSRIFDRCGLTYRPVEADSGAIGGNGSHEFMVLADMADLERVLQRCEPDKVKLIVVDGVFSMEGDLCNLRRNLRRTARGFRRIPAGR